VLANMPRRHPAEAILAIGPREVSVLDDEVVSRLPTGGIPALRTELDPIVSRPPAERVADRLGLVADPDARRELRTDYPVLGRLAATASQASRPAAFGATDLVEEPAAATSWTGCRAA
jgi:uncharacterized protein involved in exopolysaccharide biosynthesis